MRSIYIEESVYQQLNELRLEDERNSQLLRRIINLAFQDDDLMSSEEEISEELSSVALNK